VFIVFVKKVFINVFYTFNNFGFTPTLMLVLNTKGLCALLSGEREKEGEQWSWLGQGNNINPKGKGYICHKLEISGLYQVRARGFIKWRE
jgi:hypothetical protein